MTTNLKSTLKVLAVYGPQIWLIFFAANLAVITVVRTAAQSQTCLTTAQVSSDSRCLYIFQSGIYQMGSRNSPHHGHPCGMDVTSIIPSSHKNNTNQYLLPNYVGSVCSGNQTATPSPTPQPTRTSTPTPVPTQRPTNPPTQAPTQPPTAAPTQAPTQRPTNAPTQVPTQAPTNSPTQPGATKTPSPVPTRTPTPTSTLIAANKTATPKPTAVVTAVPTITPQPTPQPTSQLFAIMAQLAASKSPTPLPTEIAQNGNNGSGATVGNTQPTPEVTPAPVDQSRYNILYWTTIGSYASFVILLITGVYMLIQKIRLRLKEIENAKNSPAQMAK